MKPCLTIVHSKGRITIPIEYRKAFHLLNGEEVIMIPLDDGILIKHKNKSLRGLLKGKIESKEFEKELKTLRKEHTLHAKPYKEGEILR